MDAAEADGRSPGRLPGERIPSVDGVDTERRRTEWGGVTTMRSGIALVTAILGVALVLVGAATLWAAALRRPEDAADVRSDRPSSPVERGIALAARLPGGERLIAWGVALLALAAVASGAITFSVTATAGTN
jgi:hypothetical protein